MTLTPSERRQEMVALIEAYYWKHNVIPTKSEQIAREFMVELDDDVFVDVLSRPDTLQHFDRIGLPVKEKQALSIKQLRWIEAIVRPADNQPLAMKMKEMKVTQNEHQRWLREPLFSRVLHEEGSKILPNERERVLKSLANQAIAGNTSATKLFLELTGEYTPKATVTTGSSEVRAILSNVLDILQSHVPQALLEKVADEFEYLLIHGVRRPNLAQVVMLASSTDNSIVEAVEAEEPEI